MSSAPPSTIEPAQRTAAKIVGVLYLVTMASSMFGELYVRRNLIVPRDAVTTAANIVASGQLYRLGLVTDLLTVAGVIALLWGLHVILKPVNKNVALLATLFRVMESAIAAASVAFAFVALRFLAGTAYLQAFDPPQLAVLSRVIMGGHGTGLSIAFIFLGLGSAIFSYLWLKSGYIPRAIAWLGIFSSLLMTVFGSVAMVFPPVGNAVGLTYMAPMFFYEVGLGIWLLAKGLKAPAVDNTSTAGQSFGSAPYR